MRKDLRWGVSGAGGDELLVPEVPFHAFIERARVGGLLLIRGYARRRIEFLISGSHSQQ